MQFQVPQFIEVEDKLFGPLTFKQFIYILGGAGLSFIFYRFLPGYAAIFLIAPTMAFSLMLAFYKVNDRPFIHTLEAWFSYTFSPKQLEWGKEEAVYSKAEPTKKIAVPEKVLLPEVSISKLKDLSWSLDIQEKIRK